MDERKQNLKGSESRDQFKLWHKSLPGWFYASDLDLILVCKNPAAPIAVLDFKRSSDSVSFSETITYNWLVMHGIRVFIVMTTPEIPPYLQMVVSEYIGGDWRPNPPKVNIEKIMEGPVSAYMKWEEALRREVSQEALA